MVPHKKQRDATCRRASWHGIRSVKHAAGKKSIGPVPGAGSHVTQKILLSQRAPLKLYLRKLLKFQVNWHHYQI